MATKRATKRVINKTTGKRSTVYKRAMGNNPEARGFVGPVITKSARNARAKGGKRAKLTTATNRRTGNIEVRAASQG